MSAATPLPIPNSLQSLYATWRSNVAWAHMTGRTVYRFDSESGKVLFLKLMDSSLAPRLEEEAKRLLWARAYLPVPEPVAYGTEGNIDWLITSGLPGRDASTPALRNQPELLVPMLAKALRRFHDTVPTENCPFDASPELALVDIVQRAGAGLIDQVGRFHPEFTELSVEGAINILQAERPADGDLVVCHGDYCFPNVLIEAEAVTAYLDLGRMGVADRWWNLATATWSVTYNLGPGYEDTFLNAYGVDPDQRKLSYYRLLDDLVS